MKLLLSLVVITKNSEELLDKTLESVKELVDETVLIDDYSRDGTIEIARKYNVRIYRCHEIDLGKQKANGLKKAKGEWILFLDSDEIISPGLKKEILQLLKSKAQSQNSDIVAYKIPYQNHFLGKPLYYGGENYAMIRLFKKQFALFHPSLVHEKIEIKAGKIGTLKQKINHYSYRSFSQLYTKFTNYAVRECEQKCVKGEKTNLKKIILYPIHMFWARFVEDKGYRDGLFRIPLDLGFAYMEFLTYFLMLFKK
ncbi:glycosyltransferase family 2 protein [Candidatus Roizmanbacteria bacterium]|nr:glycosyltransferase family 2 protein [Candidatus Roizmanbacteria bacterium]